MTATPIPQLKREALADLIGGWQERVDSFGASLDAMPPLLSVKPKRWRSDVSDVAACAAVEGRAIGAGEVTI